MQMMSLIRTYSKNFRNQRSMATFSNPSIAIDRFPIGPRIGLPGHFLEPAILEVIRFIGSEYECRVRLIDGTPDPKLDLFLDNDRWTLLCAACFKLLNDAEAWCFHSYNFGYT